MKTPDSTQDVPREFAALTGYVPPVEIGESVESGIGAGGGVGGVLRRVWDMPHKHTFRINAVRCLLRRFVGNGRAWADPFANCHSPAEHTNDLNPETTATHHMDAVEFLATFAAESLAGVLLDPPYSMHQCTVSYKGYGTARVNALTPVYDQAARIVKPGGLVLCFGWNSNGIGAGRGFKQLEVVMIPHGGHHNDTLVTVERKNATTGELFGLAGGGGWGGSEPSPAEKGHNAEGEGLPK